jgi:hypothetical protein
MSTSNKFGTRKLIAWLDAHPGARFILTASTAELCARNLDGREPDDQRFVSSELPLVASELAGMVDEMEAWEGDDFAFRDEEELLGEIFGELRRADDGDDEDDGETVNDPSFSRTPAGPLVMPLPLPQELFSEGESRTLVVRPQRAFSPQRFVVPSSMAALGFVVESLTFGGETTHVGLPSELFSEAALPLQLPSGPIFPNQTIEVQVRRDPSRALFVGMLMGTVEPPASTEPEES